MKRNDFLKGIGLAGATALIPISKLKAGTAASCTLSPTGEEGPFPYTPDGTIKNEIQNPLNRSNIITNSADSVAQTGVPLTLNLTVVTVADCIPLPGVRVDLWHCNKDGWYSGYANQNGGYGSTTSYLGKDWHRGYQITDANGAIQIQTMYPGWYQGRATHIHFEFFVDGIMKRMTQLAFNETTSNTVHTSTLYAAHGTNTQNNATDHVWANATDLANSLLNPTGDVTNGYTASHQFALDNVTAPTNTGIDEASTESLSLYPNPVSDSMVLSHPKTVVDTVVRVVSMDGRTVASGILPAGATATTIDASKLSSGLYMLVIDFASGRQAMKFVKQ